MISYLRGVLGKPDKGKGRAVAQDVDGEFFVSKEDEEFEAELKRIQAEGDMLAAQMESRLRLHYLRKKGQPSRAQPPCFSQAATIDNAGEKPPKAFENKLATESIIGQHGKRRRRCLLMS